MLDELQVDRGREVAIEEFLTGHEGFYDTLTVCGKVVLDFACHYYPNVLEAMRTRWISPQIVCTNRIDAEGYDEVRQMGQRAIDALGIWTSATHMEWFFGDKGLKFSEIGCRPPGVGVWDLYSAANDIDLYAAWAHAIVHENVPFRPSRKYAAGMIAAAARVRWHDHRPTTASSRCRIGSTSGSSTATCRRLAPRRKGSKGGYMANAYVRLRHPTTTHCAR